MLADGEGNELRQYEAREIVDGVLIVVLGEEKQAGLPSQRRAVREFHRAGRRGRESHLFRELEVLLGVAARDERQRRVIPIGQVVGLPADEPRCRTKRVFLASMAARDDARRYATDRFAPLT